MGIRAGIFAGVALAVGVAAMTPPGINATPAASAASAKHAGEQDLKGRWQLDDAASDAAIKREERLKEFDDMGRLPAKFRIFTGDGGLAISDSTGMIIQVIRYGPVNARDSTATPPVFAGAWDGDRLKVKRVIGEDTITETFTLGDDARTLIVRTKIHREHASDFDGKRTFVKVTKL